MGDDGSFVMLAPPKPWPRGMRLDALEWDEFLDIMAEYRFQKNADKADQSTQVELERYEKDTQTTKVEMVSKGVRTSPLNVRNAYTNTKPPVVRPKPIREDVKKRGSGVSANMNVVRPLQEPLRDNSHNTASTSKYAGDGRTTAAQCIKSRSFDDNQKIRHVPCTIELREGSNGRRVSFEDYKRRNSSVETPRGRDRTPADSDENLNQVMDFVQRMLKRLKNLAERHAREHPSRTLSFITECTKHTFHSVEQIISGKNLGEVIENDRKREEQWKKTPLWIREKGQNRHNIDSSRGSTPTQDETYNNRRVKDDLSDGEVCSSGRSSEEKEPRNAEPKMRHPPMIPLIRRSFSNDDSSPNRKETRSRSPRHKKLRSNHSTGNTRPKDSRPRPRSRSPRRKPPDPHPCQDLGQHRRHHPPSKRRSNSPRRPTMPRPRSPPRDPRIQHSPRERSRDFPNTRISPPHRNVSRDTRPIFQPGDDFHNRAPDFHPDDIHRIPPFMNGNDRYQQQSSYLPSSELSPFPYKPPKVHIWDP